MIRTKIKLDETTYALAKQRTSAENKSVDAVVRVSLHQYLAPTGNAPEEPTDYSFVASGKSTQGCLRHSLNSTTRRWRSTSPSDISQSLTLRPAQLPPTTAAGFRTLPSRRQH